MQKNKFQVELCLEELATVSCVWGCELWFRLFNDVVLVMVRLLDGRNVGEVWSLFGVDCFSLDI